MCTKSWQELLCNELDIEDFLFIELFGLTEQVGMRGESNRIGQYCVVMCYCLTKCNCPTGDTILYLQKRCFKCLCSIRSSFSLIFRYGSHFDIAENLVVESI